MLRGKKARVNEIYDEETERKKKVFKGRGKGKIRSRCLIVTELILETLKKCLGIAVAWVTDPRMPTG